MKLSLIALKNLKRNSSFYSLYIFSISFILMIFFCFTSFSMNEIIMKKISSDGRVETMCKMIAIFLMFFVVFYMFYSNNFFMRRRMKELGIYALLGYRKSTILELLTFENVFICIGGFVVGVIAGGLLHKGVTAAITVLLGLSIDNSQIALINWGAVKFNLVFVVVVIITLTISNARLLVKSTLFNLVRLEKKVEKPIHPHLLSAVISVILLTFGYGLALNMLKGKESVWTIIGFSPIALLTMLTVVLGTILFIYSFLPFVCKWIKHHKDIFYRENTIIVVPKFMHHIRANTKSLILLILLSAGTLAVFGATTLSIWYPYKSLERIIPSAIEYRITDEQQRQTALQVLTDTLGENNYKYHETQIIKITASSNNLPTEYNISEEKGRIAGFECISQKDYQVLLEEQGRKNTLPDLTDKECVLLKYRPDYQQTDFDTVYHLNIGDGETSDVTVIQTSLENPIGFANSIGTLVISDGLYDRIQESDLEKILVASVNGAKMRTNNSAYEALYTVMSDNIYLVSASQRAEELMTASSSTFLLICFATVIFLIATGSILYFQNISAITYDHSDYKIMQRMGYSPTMIKKAVRSQIQIYYLIPYVMGLMHSIFAIVCYKSALMDDLLGKSSAVFLPVFIAVAIFTIVYLIYYQVTKYSCYKIAFA